MVLEFIQSIYEELWLLLASISQNWSETFRKLVIRIICFLTAVYFLVRDSYHRTVLIFTDNTWMMLFIAIVLILMICCAERGTRAVVWNKKIVLLNMAFGCVVLIISCIHPIRAGITQLGFFMLIVMPLMSMINANLKYFDYLCDVFALTFIILNNAFLLLCFLAQPYVKGYFYAGYSGITINPNLLGMVCIEMTIAAVYFLIMEEHQHISATTIGTALGMSLLAKSRTAILTECVLVFLYLLVHVKGLIICKKKINRRFLTGMILTIFFFVISLQGMDFITTHTTYRGIGVIREPLEKMNFATFDYDKEDLKKPADPANNTESASSHIISDTKNYDPEAKANEPKTKTNTYVVLDRLSSGRLSIYKLFIRESNLTGHFVQGTDINIEGSVLGGAHNTPLEYVYHCGWIAGILSLLTEIIITIVAIRTFWSGSRRNKAICFAVLVVLAYFVESMLEIQILPLNRDLTFMYYLMAPVLFCRHY